jgi:pimeloyl-ACP methyl ester carboxylesterase
VLVPGFLETRAAFALLAEQWASRYRVILMDVLGHGESGCTGYVHSMEDQADAVLAVLKAERIRFFRVAGHSMGGYIALALMDRVPERLRGVLLMNTHPFADSEERRALRRRAMEIAKKEKSSYLHAAIPALVAPGNAVRLKAELQAMVEAARTMPVQGILAAQEGMMARPDRTSVLRVPLAFPVAVVAGAEDPVIPLEVTEAFWHLPAVTERRLLPGGHLSFLEAGRSELGW